MTWRRHSAPLGTPDSCSGCTTSCGLIGGPELSTGPSGLRRPINMGLTTAEQMALAVLQGDLMAARALADHLLEGVSHGTVSLPPVRVLTTAEPERLRAVAYVKDDTGADEEDVRLLRVAIQEWLAGRDRNPLILSGVDRIEVYELPPPTTCDAGERVRRRTNPVEDPRPDDETGKVRIPTDCIDVKDYN